nr:hypothetical protein Hi04_10k_c3120_00031 [uncultured bacterium]
MRRARAHGLVLGLTCFVLGLGGAVPAAASPDPCASSATLSPCFDADPWWVPTGPTPFAGVPSARTLPRGALGLVLGLGLSTDPVVLVSASPHPDGQEIDAVEATSTVTLGARYGLGQGIDVGVALPFVPYQTGAGIESVTSQAPASLDPVALRDPRLGFTATLLGREPRSPLSLATHLELALPLGHAAAFAGAAGFTVAPGFTGQLSLDRLELALDLGLRLTRAVSLGTVREGSSGVVALGVSVAVLRAPLLAVGVEAVLRPNLVGTAPGAPAGALDLPAEWLGSVRFVPDERWALLAGAGTGLPLSRSGNPDAANEAAFGVTAPAFRALFTARYTLPDAF